MLEIDRSHFGHGHRLSARISPAVEVVAEIEGGGELIVLFSLAKLAATLDALVNITVTLPDGSTVHHPRRFLRARPPLSGSATTTFQVDHEVGGILAAGVPDIAAGWFAGGYTGEFVGCPLTVSGPFVYHAPTLPGLDAGR